MAAPTAHRHAWDDGDWQRGSRAIIVYVPTPQAVVDKMLEVANVTNRDVVYDLGCGDGRIVVTAAKRFGARAVGFDLDPERIEESRENVRRNGVESLVTIRRADFLSVDLSPATVVTIYLHDKIDQLLVPQLQALKPGARVVSHDFGISGAKPRGEWRMMAPFFGDSNELYEAGVPEDSAHYTMTEHRIYLWVTPFDWTR